MLELHPQPPQPIETGSAVFVPAGTAHTIANRQLRLLSLLAVDEPPPSG